MEAGSLKKAIFGTVGLFTLIGYIFISLAIRDDAMIWYATRIFGIVAFLLLATTIILGELRLLHLVKADFPLFRFHVPIAIASTFVVILHGISGIADNYKWGATLSWIQYLGFSFSDKWLVYISLGTLAFYIMAIVGVSSIPGVIQRIGYKIWKYIHYLSYAAFYMSFYHSIKLGTDMHNAFGPYLQLLSFVILVCVTAFLLVRIVKTFNVFEIQNEVYALCVIVGVLLVVTFGIFGFMQYQQLQLSLAQNHLSLLQYVIDAQQVILGGAP